MTAENQSPNGLIGSDLVRNDPFFEDLVVEFVGGLSERLQAMEKAIYDGDFEALRVAAHQLKGTGGGYGYPVITERAAELERHAEQQVLGDCEVGLASLRELCERVVVSLDE